MRCNVRVLKRNVRSLTLGSLTSDDGDGNENGTKAIGFISKTTILHAHHAFLYISLPSLHDYDVKLPNFTFMEDVNTQDNDFLFLFVN